MSRGVQMREPSGATWLFDAGAESLDLVHTATAEAGSDALGGPAALGRWLADRAPRFDPAATTERDLADARALRDAIGRLASAAADGAAPAAEDVDVVNLFAALPDVPPRLAGGSRQAGASRVDASRALASLARDAIAMLGEPDRLRRCAAEDCRLLFRDESRTGTRRWCSMERCGNRAKVRAHRARRREG